MQQNKCWNCFLGSFANLNRFAIFIYNTFDFFQKKIVFYGLLRLDRGTHGGGVTMETINPNSNTQIIVTSVYTQPQIHKKLTHHHWFQSVSASGTDIPFNSHGAIATWTAIPTPKVLHEPQSDFHHCAILLELDTEIDINEQLHEQNHKPTTNYIVKIHEAVMKARNHSQ